MSSFITKAKHKKSGEIHEIFCHDDYFGPHKYGYRTPANKVLNQAEFDRQYEECAK